MIGECWVVCVDGWSAGEAVANLNKSLPNWLATGWRPQGGVSLVVAGIGVVGANYKFSAAQTLVKEKI